MELDKTMDFQAKKPKTGVRRNNRRYSGVDSITNKKIMKNSEEKAIIIKKVKDSKLSLEQIAKDFGISRKTLYQRMDAYGIPRSRKRGRRKGQTKKLKIA